MYKLTKRERVRARGSVVEHAAVSAGNVTYLAAIAQDDVDPAVQTSEEFERLFQSAGHRNALNHSTTHDGRLAAVESVLHSSEAHILQCTLAIADLSDAVSATMRVIRASQQLIYKSDLLIARSRTLDCE